MSDLATQPPSGGCVLKPHRCSDSDSIGGAATFGWLCVETIAELLAKWSGKQPPSGGCVLKQLILHLLVQWLEAATFGWLCVETKLNRFE